MSEPETHQDGYQIEDDGYHSDYEDGYYDGTYNKRIPHDWEQTKGVRVKGVRIKIVCKRCGQTRDKIIKKIPTSDLVNAVMSNSGTNFENMRDVIDEMVENDWCLSEDELAVKDIIE